MAQKNNVLKGQGAKEDLGMEIPKTKGKKRERGYQLFRGKRWARKTRIFHITSPCNRQNNASHPHKDVYVFIPGTHDYVMLHGKEEWRLHTETGC